MKTKYLYLDVDGVLLGKDDPGSMEIVLARHAGEFLEYCLRHYECYWLTTHCKEGDASPVIKQLRAYVDGAISGLIDAVKPTVWKTLKTEAIDLSSDFYWIDDGILQCEKEILKRNNVFSRWIEVNTRKYPDDLKRAILILEDMLY
ncbi:MAG: hypothetical protein KAS92_01040 [Candidatus Omnitrophica bacterium]|nr:hypothetical protein [Candidatus Omnitrophota bacterium]